MERTHPLIYLTVLLVGLALSFFVIRSDFDINRVGLLVFFFVFIPTFLYPDIGLGIMIVSMLFSPEVALGRAGAREIAVRIEDVILIVVLLAWFIRTALRKDIVKVFKTPLTLPFSLYLAAGVLATLLATFSDAKFDLKLGLFSLLKYAEYFLIFFMVRYHLKSRAQVRMFVSVFLATAALVALFSNISIQQNIALGKEFFRITPPVDPGSGHESGTLGGYLVFMIGIVGGLFFYSRGPGRKLLLACLAFLMIRALLYTLSRGCYLALVPMLAALFLFSRKPLYVLVFVATLPFFALSAPRMIRERIVSTVAEKQSREGAYLELEESAYARLDVWKGVLAEKFPQRPVFGHGVGRYFIDGQFALTLTETGLLGLAFFAWLMARLYRLARSSLLWARENKDGLATGLCVGFLAGFIGLLFTALSMSTFIIIGIMEPFWFMAAIALSLPDLRSGPKAL